MPKIHAFWWDGEYEESHDMNAIDAVELYGENQNPLEGLR